MPVALPDEHDVKLAPPDSAEVAVLARGVVSAVAPAGGLTDLQAVLISATFDAMTGYSVDPRGVEPIEATAFAHELAYRNEMFRTRILQVMLLGALVLRPLPRDVVARVEEFARELSVRDDVLAIAQLFAEGSLGLAAFDFQRNGYTAEWSEEKSASLHTSRALADAWEASVADPVLAARWEALEHCLPDSIGRRMFEFYCGRGFEFPGRPGSAPPLLAQHDWVHVLVDYGTRVESELEVFAFIARANDDPRAFSLLAMVVSLFETGYLRTGAGLFESFPGQMSRRGVAIRVADAMRRGALCDGSVDFLAVDWFALADRSVEELRQEFGVTAKSTASVDAGSVGPWEQGGISEFQDKQGRAMAERNQRPYESFGASV